MSFRQDVADAVALIPDVNGYPKAPRVVQTGDLWPL